MPAKSAVPAAAKKPQDRAAKAEAKRDVIEVEHHGLTYTIERENADDVELFEHLEQDHVMTALKGFLGPVQWAKFKNAHRGANGKVSVSEIEPLLDSILTAIGGGAGNS